jgi:hypothetical protein
LPELDQVESSREKEKRKYKIRKVVSRRLHPPSLHIAVALDGGCWRQLALAERKRKRKKFIPLSPMSSYTIRSSLKKKKEFSFFFFSLAILEMDRLEIDWRMQFTVFYGIPHRAAAAAALTSTLSIQSIKRNFFL